MLRLLQERAKAGVEIRVIGKIEKRLDGVKVRKLADLRLHVRAIVRDGTAVFVGSQSLRKLELDGRREVGLIASDSRIAAKVQSVFESDWADSARKEPEKPREAAPDEAPAKAALSAAR